MSAEATEVKVPASGPEQEKPPRDKRMVLVYIVILFAAAFLMMGLSLLVHQRTNTQALDKLQSSVTAMQEVQNAQEQIIDLQNQLAAAEDALAAQEQALTEEMEQKLSAAEAAAREEAEKQAAALEQSRRESEAMQGLYNLQQDYLARNYDGCRAIVKHMEDNALVDLLPKSAMDDATPPFERYFELKDAVLNR